MNDLDFKNKAVLVVGGSSGIGNGIAHAFARRGAVVHITGTRGSVEDYAAQDGTGLEGLSYQQLNLSSPAALAGWKPAFETLDVLILSQGTVRYGREEFEIDTFRAVVEINLNSIMACASRFHDMLAASQGALIIISSTAAYGARVGNPAYAASKSGAVALTRTLAEAWAGDGIRVNGVAPGLVPSKLTAVTMQNEDRLAKALKQIPLRRLGTPDEIAGAVLFLASPLASYVIGHTIVVDGGKSLS